MITFKITPEMEADIKKKAEAMAKERIEDLLKYAVSAYFGNSHSDPRHSKPVAYMVIDEIVSKTLEDEGMQERIAKRVKEKLDAAIEAAADAVVEHHTKKAAFKVHQETAQ